MRHGKKRLGDILQESGLITEAQLTESLDRQKRTKERLGKVLVGMGLVNESQILQALSRQLGIPIVDLSNQPIDPGAARMIPESVARKHTVIPLKREGNTLTIAMADPMDVFAINDVEIATRCIVNPVAATETQILNAIGRAYAISGIAPPPVTPSAPPSTQTRGAQEEAVISTATMPMPDVEGGEEGEQAPAVRLVNQIITQALKEGASDIHIEPEEENVRIRLRVDGVLHALMTVPKNIQAPLVSRIKVMARMNIAERRIPQDGAFELAVDGQRVDFRAAALPTIHGEQVTLRLLSKGSTIPTLQDLGLQGDTLKRYEKMIHQPYGIILVCGPTGSGKTTTLVSSLNAVNSADKKIITIEDPVEYQLPGCMHVQINPKAGLTFANSLRSVVRHDPDIIMVGEIRDAETAEISIHASLTGHLVISTIHTNDAASALTRLLDMGIEPYLVASSVMGTLSQRLIRVLCPHCKKPTSLDAEIREALTSALGEGFNLPAHIYVREGCPRCKYSGYRGRTGLFEVLTVSESIRKLVFGRASSNAVGEVAIKEGMTTMREDGLTKVAMGVTTVEEVLRVTRIEE
ncbi:MAG: Flp pilus assembly complex ATPase component TadA [Armatimonadetes bacterium]|nr:Flp pilus assembly complex ATPase component TadA [Armatimonadota bacterium]